MKKIICIIIAFSFCFGIKGQNDVEVQGDLDKLPVNTINQALFFMDDILNIEVNVRTMKKKESIDGILDKLSLEKRVLRYDWFIPNKPNKTQPFIFAKQNIRLILCDTPNTEGYLWQITDVAGGSVKMGKFNSNVEVISTQALQLGIYLIRVVTDNTLVKVEKFLIIK